MTGATGAVGHAVAERLLHTGFDVRALVRKPEPGLARGIQAVRGDLASAASLEHAARGIDVAVHCAAAVGSELALCQSTNVDGTSHLLQALHQAGCRALVHVSTLSVYDMSHPAELDETCPLLDDPRLAYGYTKARAEALVRASGEHGLAWVILRPALVLSLHPRSRWGPLVFDAARACAGPIFPAPVVPHVHVDHLVDAIVFAVREPKARGQIYNVVDGEAPTAEYFAVVYGALGRTAPVLPADAPRPRFSSEKLRRDLGNAPPSRWREFLRGLEDVGRQRG